ncbi:hypothetical protein GJ496_009630 [Pomphorhynchus laevis]|nr:hypothetical protein GJ496_009630 [Pomphorhynchus laevis]
MSIVPFTFCLLFFNLDKLLDELMSPIAMSPACLLAVDDRTNAVNTTITDDVTKETEISLQNVDHTRSAAESNISGDITKSNRENQNYSVSSIDTEPLKIRIRLGAKPAVSNPSSLCQSDSVAENKSDPIVSPNEAIRRKRNHEYTTVFIDLTLINQRYAMVDFAEIVCFCQASLLQRRPV